MSYLHIDIFSKQTSKIQGSPCGDVIGFERDDSSTTLILSDGIGSGIRANIAANMCVSRLLSLMRNGATLREAFSAMVATMNKAWGTTEPFAVFTVARFLYTGEVTILTYEMPSPVLINPNGAYVLQDRTYTIGKAIISEANCSLETKDSLLIVSDGITQSGLGRGFPNGWMIENVAGYILKNTLNKGIKCNEIVDSIHNKAIENWGAKIGDDCSVVVAHGRHGITSNIITGPPDTYDKDTEWVGRFMEMEGHKIVCGGSTAKMVARILKRTLNIEAPDVNGITPPKYKIKGINLVTEGAVTLNQVFNILDEETEYIEEKTPVFELAEFMNIADKIVFWLGNAKNPGSENIEFLQQGILPRKKIIEKLVERLKKKDKLVVIKQ